MALASTIMKCCCVVQESNVIFISTDDLRLLQIFSIVFHLRGSQDVAQHVVSVESSSLLHTTV